MRGRLAAEDGPALVARVGEIALGHSVPPHRRPGCKGLHPGVFMTYPSGCPGIQVETGDFGVHRTEYLVIVVQAGRRATDHGKRAGGAFG